MKFERHHRESLSKQVQLLHKDTLASIKDLACLQNKVSVYLSDAYRDTESARKEVKDELKTFSHSINNFTDLVSLHNTRLNHLETHSRESDVKIKRVNHFCERIVPLMTYYQVSDAVQSFLCLSDQAKLVQMDNEHVRHLATHKLTFDQIEDKVWKIAQLCQKSQLGLAPFKLDAGERLSSDFVEKRRSLLESHARTYKHMHEA